MSGITAIFRRNETVAQREFEAVFHALDHRGFDGADAATFDRVALGHQHSYTTPEELGERQPIALDDLWITFDGRIDNRTEMFDLLASAGERPSSEMSDAKLVLRAYRDLGDAFLERLVGAFAFCIWDPADGRLLVARDRTGIRELYYADTGDVVVVASEMQAILEHPAVSPDVNEGFVGELLSSYFVTHEETFFRNIQPVEAGSFLDVTAGGTRAESYWDVWNADVEFDPAKDTAEQFRDLLEEAVACRLRAPKLPGIMMSGGLDSTTVACLARRRLDRTGGVDDDLHSFSLVIDGVDYFEAEVDRIDSVVDHCDLESHTLRANDHYVLKDIEMYEREARESPVYSPVNLASEKLYERASDIGRNVMLTGIAGNLYDGSRLYYLDLVRQGRLATFVRHALADPMPFGQLVLWYVLAQSSDRLGQYLMERSGRDEPDVPPWIDPEFAERCRLADRVSADIETGIDSAAHEQLFKRYFRRARPFEDAVQRRVALRAGVELRCPYLDSRLLAFMVALPPGELNESGQDKALFRDAMKGVLPETVRTHSASVTFDPIVDAGILDERKEYVEALFADSKLAELGIVDETAFETHVESLLEEGVGRRRIWDLISMELWLREWA